MSYDSQIASQILPEAAEHLGPYFVYALIDPRDNQIFYIGKGKGTRPNAHGDEATVIADKNRHTKSAKIARIKEIRDASQEYVVDIMRYGLCEKEAYLVEAALIDGIGLTDGIELGNLTNAVRGHGTGQGRTRLAEINSEYGAPDVDEDAPSVLLILLGDWVDELDDLRRKGWGYKPGITYQETVDAARAWWSNISPNGVKKRGVEHAVAVHKSITRAVMKIGEWQQNERDQWAFEATPITEGPIFDQWVGPHGKRVSLKKGTQGPLYWPFK